MKKKPQRYSHKKLLSTRVRPDLQSQSNQKSHFINPPQSTGPKSSARNKSAQKILSVYQSSRAKFKLGKFLNDKPYRVKTQNDEFNKTKTNFIKGANGTKIGSQNMKERQKLKDREEKTGRYYTNSGTHKAVNTNNTVVNTKGKIYQGDQRLRLPLDMTTKQRAFNKRLNLNSQLFDQIPYNDSSLQKNMPQTSKHQKRSNFSFRKQHDSYRAGNKKTALEKYISESLQNLQCPVKKKNSRNLGRQKSKDKSHIEILMTNTNSKQKQQRQFSHIQEKKKLLIYKGSKQTEKQSGAVYDILAHNTDQLVHSHRPKHTNLQHPTTHRRLQTQTDDSLQKIEIKWEKKRRNPYDMSNEEMQTYGDRFPDGFEKMRLLGRGGFSLVWLGEHKKSRKQYAVKQIITESNHETHKKEIQFGKYFFEFGGVAKDQFLQHPGIKNLVKLYYYFINKKDTWLLYEKCGDSLGNVLYELKGEHYNGEKMYRIHYKQFYSTIRNNQLQLKKIIYQVAKALLLLSQNNIVHSDLKTQNILVSLKNQDKQCEKTLNVKTSGRKIINETLDVKHSARNKNLNQQSVIEEVKLIDYGSSFQFTNLRQFSMATPQYMAPQILNFILYENQLQYVPKLFDYVQQYHNPWVIDVWSLGCVLLQILSGIPLWMSLKTIVKRKSKELVRYGLFAVKGRTFDKIIKKQLQVVQNLDQYLVQQNYSDIVPDQDIKYLLKKMLALNPNKRISPTQIVSYLEKIVNQ